MRSVTIIIVFLFASLACEKSGTNTSKCVPEKKDYIYESGRQIEMQGFQPPDTAFEHYNYTINSGAKEVFNFTVRFQDCPEIADDEGSRIIVFEIPGNLNS